jgi:hypothetical protein
MNPHRTFLLARSSCWILALATTVSIGASLAASAQAQQAAPAAAAEASAPLADEVYTAEEIEKLVAPVALYPDALLAQALPASAYPVDIVQAQRWLDKNKSAVAKQDYSGLDGQTWDPAVKALARFPDVIKKMNDDLDWTTDLGDAFVSQPKDVADAIQRMRAKAETTGSLRTNQQQKVVKQKDSNRDVIIIESANPEVVYVPVYDPVQVYDPLPGVVATSLLTFGTAVAIGSVWNNNYWNWGSGVVYPPRWPGYPGYRPGGGGNNNINIGNDINIGNNNVGNNVRPWRPDGDRYRPGQGSKPGLRPENRPGARPGEGGLNRPGASDRPGQGGGLGQAGMGAGIGAGVGAGIAAGNRPGDRPGAGAGNRPGGDRPGAGAGNRPGADRPGAGAGVQRPTTRPSMAKPGGAFGGVSAGREPAQAFSNRGGQSVNRGPAMGGERPAMGRPAGMSRPSGGGGGRVGGGGRGRGDRR